MKGLLGVRAARDRELGGSPDIDTVKAELSKSGGRPEIKRKAEMELIEQISREYEFGLGTIRELAHKLGASPDDATMP